MANPQHLEWLKEGVRSWNERRRNAPFAPELDETDVSRYLGAQEREDIRQISVILPELNLSNANLSKSTLRSTDLSSSHFLSTNLSETRLQGSRFDGSLFVGSNLRKSYLASASLANTKMWLTNLESAVLVNASLKNAELWECNLEGTDLYSADLTGAKFIRSRPWRARLLRKPGQQPLESATLEVDRIEELQDLLNAVRQLRDSYDDKVVLYFRGENQYFDALQPSVMRAPDPGQSPLRRVESEMLNELLTQQPDAFNGLDSSLSQWVMAQHHRLKTRLLDITRNPQVALFFACHDNYEEDGRIHVFAVPRSIIEPFNSDSVSIVANFAKLPRAEQNILLGKTEVDTVDDEYPEEAGRPGEGPQLFSKAEEHLYSLIRRERPDLQGAFDVRDLYRIFVVEPQQMFERIRAQSGAFLISAFHERFERTEALKANRDTQIYAHYELRVKSHFKRTMLDDLRLYNISLETLLPSLDESARAITNRYLRESN